MTDTYYKRNKSRVLARQKAKREMETEEQRDERRRYFADYRACNEKMLKHQGRVKYAENREKILAEAAAKRRAAGIKPRVVLPPVPADRPWRVWKKKKRSGTSRQWMHARRRARDVGVPYDRAIEKIPFPAICPVLGIPLSREADAPLASRPSIDRMVPEKGYVVGNVRIISFRANTLKSDATVDEVRRVLLYTEEAELLS